MNTSSRVIFGKRQGKFNISEVIGKKEVVFSGKYAIVTLSFNL